MKVNCNASKIYSECKQKFLGLIVNRKRKVILSMVWVFSYSRCIHCKWIWGKYRNSIGKYYVVCRYLLYLYMLPTIGIIPTHNIGFTYIISLCLFTVYFLAKFNTFYRITILHEYYANKVRVLWIETVSYVSNHHLNHSERFV